MKARWISISITVLMLISAGLALTTESLTTEASITEAQAADELAQKNGCFECHSVNKKVIGPAFHDIAEKYKGDASARSTLIEKVKKGGKGNWTKVTGGVPMPPYSPRLSNADIERLVDWVLSL